MIVLEKNVKSSMITRKTIAIFLILSFLLVCFFSFTFLSFLSLDSTGVGNSFDEVFFPIQIDQYGWYHINNRNRKRQPDFSLIDL